MAQSKATKKFEKRHLTDTLKKRKEFAKVKQRHQINDKRKAKNAQAEAAAAQGKDGEPPQKKSKKQDAAGLQEMSVDDFFAGGFEMPKQQGKPATSRKEPKKDEKSEKKRKRQDAADDEGDSSASSMGDEPNPFEGSDDDADEDAGANGEKNEADAHMGDLKALAKKDPEFYKYLQENDAELLDFAETAGLDEVDELSGSDEDGTSKKKKGKKDDVNISKATVQKWTKAMMEKHSLTSMREMVLAFRAAAHLNEEAGKQYKYTISNADVYNEVVTGALRHVPTVLNHHLPVKQMPNGKMRIQLDSKKFRTLTNLLKSHIVSVQHLLSNLTDAATTRLTLNSILELTPYILSFKKAVREVIKAVVEIWSSSSQDETIRISAFLILRRLAVIADQGIKEDLLRTTYQGLIKGSRTTTIHNLAGINLMKNSALELWGLVEPNIAYTTAFNLVRQLAIHLRTSIKNNANDAYKAVYNWQYVHSLDFWSRTLSTHCETLKEASSGKTSPLRPLIYPLTQVTLGALRLIPTSAYFPLRFHLTRSLLRLSSATHTFIPLAAPLYEVLTSAEMKKPPKASTLKPLDFETNIRANKAYLRTRVYQDGVGEQVAELLGEFFHLWCKSIAFPELALPVIVMLRRWVKEVSPWNASTTQQANGAGGKRGGKHAGGQRGGKPNIRPQDQKGNRNTKINQSVILLIQKLEANSRFISEKRAKVEFAPNDRAGVEGFLKEVEKSKTPVGAFVEGQRVQREERRKVLEEGRRREDTKKGKDGRDGKDEEAEEEWNDDDGEDSDGDEAEGEQEEEEEEEEEEDEMEIDGEEERELDDDEVEALEF